MIKENQILIIPEHQQSVKAQPDPTPPPLQNNFSNQLFQLFSLQFQLNQQLQINQYMIDHYTVVPGQALSKNQSSTVTALSGSRPKLNKKQINHPRNKNMKERKRKAVKQESDYQPQFQDSDSKNYKESQSKNIAKCYGKLIISYIIKNINKFEKVLKENGTDKMMLLLYIEGLKGCMNTIADLRSLWIQSEQNKYSRVIRILSMHYLRTDSLSYIFNSRIQCFLKHLKYRQKLIKAVKNPMSFTHLKEF